MSNHSPTGTTLSKAQVEDAAWAAIGLSFAERSDFRAECRDEGVEWSCIDETADQVRMMRAAATAFEALRELYSDFSSGDVADLVYAACGYEPFEYHDEMKAREAKR
jgi:hypothetical protein